MPGGIGIDIVRLEARNDGGEVILTVRLAPEGEPDGGRDNRRADFRRICVSSKMLFEIGNIGVGSLPYRLSTEQFDSLEYSAKLWECVKKGIDLIAYSDNTRASLITKLKQRGFDRYLSEDAVEYIAGLRLIDEGRMIRRAAEQLANVKLYGPSRIRAELTKKGYSRENIAEVLSELDPEVDFGENLTKLIRKKCDLCRLSDRGYRESVYASLFRYGYPVSEIRSAIKQIQENDYE